MIPRVLRNQPVRIGAILIAVVYVGLGLVASIYVPKGRPDEPLWETVLFKTWLLVCAVPLFLIGAIYEWLDDRREAKIRATGGGINALWN